MFHYFYVKNMWKNKLAVNFETQSSPITMEYREQRKKKLNLITFRICKRFAKIVFERYDGFLPFELNRLTYIWDRWIVIILY